MSTLTVLEQVAQQFVRLDFLLIVNDVVLLQLLFQNSLGEQILYHVGSIQAINTVGAEDARLLTLQLTVFVHGEVTELEQGE